MKGERASMNTMTTRMAAFAVGLGMSLFGCGGNGGNRGNAGPGAVFVSGRIEGDVANVAPSRGGRIVEVLVREGDSVQQGALLAVLSGEQVQASRAEAEARLAASRRRLEQARQEVNVLEARLRQATIQEGQADLEARGRVAQAEGQLAAAQAELTRAQADLEQNVADAKRYGELAEKGAVPRQQAEQFETRVRTSRALVEAAQKQVAAAEGSVEIARASLENPKIRAAEIATLRRQIEQARANVLTAQAEVEASAAFLQRAEADVADLIVEAPFTGQVITRVAEPGQVVGAGTTLLTLVDPAQLYLRGFVPEGRIGLVKVGQAAEVFLDSAPETPLPAEVIRIDPQAMFTPENTYFQEDRVRQVVGVKVLIKSDGGAKLGMPADARILTGAETGAR